MGTGAANDYLVIYFLFVIIISHVTGTANQYVFFCQSVCFFSPAIPAIPATAAMGTGTASDYDYHYYHYYFSTVSMGTGTANDFLIFFTFLFFIFIFYHHFNRYWYSQ